MAPVASKCPTEPHGAQLIPANFTQAWMPDRNGVGSLWTIGKLAASGAVTSIELDVRRQRRSTMHDQTHVWLQCSTAIPII